MVSRNLMRNALPLGNFCSTLSDSHISDEDYTHAKNVWNTFNCRMLGDQIRTDVNLFCDVFENFRKTAMKNYTLDPANYLPYLVTAGMLY